MCVCVVINRDGAHPGGLFVSGSVTDGASLFTRSGGGGDDEIRVSQPVRDGYTSATKE